MIEVFTILGNPDRKIWLVLLPLADSISYVLIEEFVDYFLARKKNNKNPNNEKLTLGTKTTIGVSIGLS